MKPAFRRANVVFHKTSRPLKDCRRPGYISEWKKEQYIKSSVFCSKETVRGMPVLMKIIVALSSLDGSPLH